MPLHALSLALTFGWSFLALAAIAFVLYLVAIAATRVHLRDEPPTVTENLPPVSLLKPLKGLEDTLEENLESFFRQDYPAPFEIVFATTDEGDPALQVARAVAARHPQVAVKFVRSDDDFGLNPKVANLAGALEAATHDLVHQSDANVRIPANYLRQIVGELLAAEASVLTSVVVGVGERRPGAAMENLQLSAFIAPAMCLALRVVDVTCVCGKSMLLYKGELNTELGGLASVRDVLCEDFVLGERYKALGKKVLLSPTPVYNVNADCGVERFVGRHGRWLKMRVTLHLPGFVADLLSNPVALSFLGVIASGFEPSVMLAAVAVVVAKGLADQVALRLVRAPMKWRYALLSPVKDLLLLPLWVNAVFGRTVVWRGRRLRFGKETRLIPLDGEPLVRADETEGYAALDPSSR
ncbi:MAG: hypothetical protein CMN30_29005 [Sandaracinus sp.]|nr:hypothetical protein [Sandaracinus sp.]|tara:strand:+ start:285 stop:1517 length:1233 start_codon:yes stop_codon:yes gene_type:complete